MRETKKIAFHLMLQARLWFGISHSVLMSFCFVNQAIFEFVSLSRICVLVFSNFCVYDLFGISDIGALGLFHDTDLLVFVNDIECPGHESLLFWSMIQSLGLADRTDGRTGGRIDGRLGGRGKGKARQGRARQGMARHGKAGHGTARQGKASQARPS